MLEECGAVNMVRRSGAPLRVVVESPQGDIELIEGKDFEGFMTHFSALNLMVVSINLGINHHRCGCPAHGRWYTTSRLLLSHTCDLRRASLWLRYQPEFS